MTKSEVLETLKEMFIDHFGINKEVNLKNQIQIDYSWDVGGTYSFNKTVTGDTAIDAVFKMIVWLKENNKI